MLSNLCDDVLQILICYVIASSLHCYCVITIFRKRVLLSREDLVLPWRPLYKLLDNSAYSRYEHHGLVLLPT